LAGDPQAAARISGHQVRGGHRLRADGYRCRAGCVILCADSIAKVLAPVPRFRMGLLDGLTPLFCSSQPHRPLMRDARTGYPVLNKSPAGRTAIMGRPACGGIHAAEILPSGRQRFRLHPRPGKTHQLCMRRYPKGGESSLRFAHGTPGALSPTACQTRKPSSVTTDPASGPLRRQAPRPARPYRRSGPCRLLCRSTLGSGWRRLARRSSC
jgi:hypothetical protein